MKPPTPHHFPCSIPVTKKGKKYDFSPWFSEQALCCRALGDTRDVGVPSPSAEEKLDWFNITSYGPGYVARRWLKVVKGSGRTTS